MMINLGNVLDICRRECIKGSLTAQKLSLNKPDTFQIWDFQIIKQNI